MAAIIIPNGTPFGSLTNQVVGRALSLESALERLQEAIATASSGYVGTPGTEFEAPVPTGAGPPNTSTPNLFGITPDPAEPGAQGQAYRYAVDSLKAQWDTFWAAAQPYLSALDNGT
jgi:hypothetical protein